MPAVRIRRAAVVLAVLSLVSCSPRADVPSRLAASPTIQPDDLVDLTLYFRAGSGPSARLQPVIREVGVSEELPHRALQLLLAGPLSEEGLDLRAPLPTSTRVVSLSIDAGVAMAHLSSHAITDAESVGASAEHELLALAAVANTLTEFPTIDYVSLSVEEPEDADRDASDFWGHWGVPALLVRDETVVGAARDTDGLPSPEWFTGDLQELGAADTALVEVSSVRLRDRITFARVVVELSHSGPGAGEPAVPSARAWSEGQTLVLELDNVAAYRAEVRPGGDVRPRATGIESIGLELTELPGTVRFRLPLTGERPFRLHALTNPTRITLDVKKASEGALDND